MLNGKRVIIPDDYKAPRDGMTHTHEDGTTHSHDGGNKSHHHHEDGTMHDHEGGDQPHTHDKETPNFGKMTKKALGEWAKEKGIVVDAKQTKANMIEDIKIQL